MESMNAFIDEVIAETIGGSRKKWALLVVAFVAGAIGALWLVRRMRRAGPANAPTELAPSE